MIGKLQVWKAGKDGAEKMKLGGLVSIDDLTSRSKTPKSSMRKVRRVPVVGCCATNAGAGSILCYQALICGYFLI
jgi:hypothetical protein